MTFWNCQYLKFKYKISNYNILDFDLRLSLIRKAVGIWITITVLVSIIYHQYIYDFEVMKEYFPTDLTINLFQKLPLYMKQVVMTYPEILSIVIIALAFLQVSKIKHEFLTSFLLCVLFNFYYCLTYQISSGATTIVCNFLTYIFLIDLFISLEKKFKNIETVKHWLFFSMKLQICIVYVISGSVKISSELWRSGAATYYIFHNKRYFKFLSILPFLDNSEYLFKISSIMPIIFLLMFPILAWTKKSWSIVLISIFFHGFIAIGMGLKEFIIFPIFDYLLFCDLKHASVFMTKLVNLMKTINNKAGKIERF